MKINNIDVEEFLKMDKMVLNKKKSEEISSKMPSIRKKHVKKPKKVEQALLDLDKNHNWSWYDEVKDRNKENMDQPMTFYRGFEQSAFQVFEDADKIAASMDKMGIKKGDKILLCMSNTPELLKILLAASRQGIVVNSLYPNIDKEYIKEIVKTNNPKLFIATDNNYDTVKDVIESSGIDRKVLISLTDSLLDGYDPYSNYDDKFYKFENKVEKYKKEDSSLMNLSEFMEFGKGHNPIKPNVSIDDDFTITYTSGSTKIGWPKAIVHPNRSYITIARFHDPDLSRMPAMRNMRGLAHIPPHSNTDIVSSISDTICQKCVVAFEPIYNPDFFPYSLLINEAGFVPATTSFWLHALKKFDTEEDLKDKKLPFALNYVAVGEEASKNEIKFINKKFKDLEAGKDKLPKPLNPITISVGGGNCEQGGLYFTLFKGLREKLSLNKSLREDFGLIPFQMADLAILNEDGTECDYNELGVLVATSPCNMKEYQNNKKATEDYKIKDAYGREWGNSKIWSYIASNGNVVLKGRYDSIVKLSSGMIVPNFLISEAILDNVDELLTCEVTTTKVDDKDIPVAHYEVLPNIDISDEEICSKMNDACKKTLSTELSSEIVFERHDKNNPFPLTGSGKRSIKLLEDKGITNSFNIIKDSNNKEKIVPASEYLKTEKPKVRIKK